MPRYKDLHDYGTDPHDAVKADWIARRLLCLRHDLGRVIRGPRKPQSLILGSWNIRAFDDGATRLDESMHYIAEIVSAFDICAIQEVKKDLGPLRRLMRLLGPDWDYFVSDVSTHEGGNHERKALVFNRNRVRFRKVVGEVVLRSDALATGRQPARSPFFAAFEAGWFRFTVCSAHIVEGLSDADHAAMAGDGLSKAARDRAARAAEIRAITTELLARARDEDEVFFFVGDMNIEQRDDEIHAALHGSGMEVPDFGPTNLSGTKYFDHIAFTVHGKAERKTRPIRSGTFDWRAAVFGPAPPALQPAPGPYGFDPGLMPVPVDPPGIERVDDATNIARYEPLIQGHRQRQGRAPYTNFQGDYQAKTTYEMSDHLPIWVEAEVDYSDDYLRQFVAQR